MEMREFQWNKCGEKMVVVMQAMDRMDEQALARPNGFTCSDDSLSLSS